MATADGLGEGVVGAPDEDVDGGPRLSSKLQLSRLSKMDGTRHSGPADGCMGTQSSLNSFPDSLFFFLRKDGKSFIANVIRR